MNKELRGIGEALLLMEMPTINKYFTPTILRQHSQQLVDYIHDNHNKSTKFGNSYHYLKHTGGAHIYYRHESEKLHEYSYIAPDHHQGAVDKNGGSVDHIHNFMKYHIKTHGHLSSDMQNTPGSKNMWINFIKNTPELKHSFSHHLSNKHTKLTPENIDSHIDNIWGDHPKYSLIRVHSEK